MAALSDDVKRFIVQALACFETPSEVAEAVKQEFGLNLPRQQIEAYDPGRQAGRALSSKWREVFEANRTQWRKEVMEIPVVNRVYRLRVLGEVVNTARLTKNHCLTLQALEQVAREVGGMYESRRRGIGNAAVLGDIPPSTPVVREGQIALHPDEPIPSRPILEPLSSQRPCVG